MPVSVPIEVRFEDIDKLQHLNNAKYLSYFEHARTKYFNVVIGGGIDWAEKGIILAKAEVDFLAPVYIDDEVLVNIWISRLGKKSFDFSYEMTARNDKGSLLAARCKTVMACYNYHLSETIEIPSDWLNKIKAFEGL